MKLEKRTYTVTEAAHLLGIGVASAYAAVKTGDIPALKVGARWVVPKSRLDALLTDSRAPRQSGSISG